MNTSATYSVEDNKLRLYFSERLDTKLYNRVKSAGFKWAPKQALFVAPMWTPQREDLCAELAGDIEAEETTLAERAEAKAYRLNTLSDKRATDANAFQASADRLSERFAGGQPILVGHHSERSARRDQKKMEAAINNAVKAHGLANYWAYRSVGVQGHANYKNKPNVRARRIKTLLADMRGYQRDLNSLYIQLNEWRNLEKLEDSDKKNNHIHILLGGLSSFELYNKHRNGEISDAETITLKIESLEKILNGGHYQRWINHTLNRLGYERGELGFIPRFEGDLTPVILQGFARTHGAEKPKATKTETGYKIVTKVRLPAHIADGCEVEKTDEQWRDFMQSAGYAVEIKERKKSTVKHTPLINLSREDAEKLQAHWSALDQERRERHNVEPSTVVEMTQHEFSIRCGDYRPCDILKVNAEGAEARVSYVEKLDEEPVFRVRVMRGEQLYSTRRIVILTDKPTKPLPVEVAA